MMILCGGTDVFPALGRKAPQLPILDISRMPELLGISYLAEGGWRIGAATTWSALINAELPPAFDALKAAAREVGSVQIQNAGSIAGNICNASPAADGVPPLLILDAEVELSSHTGQRILPLAEFLQGVRQTALGAGEIVTALRIPEVSPTLSSAFQKLGARRYLIISIAMVAVAADIDEEGKLKDVRVSVGACSPTGQRLTVLEDALIGQAAGRILEIPSDAFYCLSPIDDVRGSVGYRKSAVSELVTRTIRSAIGIHPRPTHG